MTNRIPPMKDRPELLELIKKAVEAFEKMTPEQQEAEIQKQRESWARQDMD